MTTLAEVRAALAMADRLAEAVLTMEPIIGRAKEYAGLRSACGALPADGVIVTPEGLARGLHDRGLCHYVRSVPPHPPVAHETDAAAILAALAAEGGPA